MINIPITPILVKLMTEYQTPKIGIVGLGFVGNAIKTSFEKHNIPNIQIYDKYKNGGIGTIQSLIDTDFIFLSLPTPYNETTKKYDLTSIHETLESLTKYNYQGTVIIKSTVSPTTCQSMATQYKLLIIHNPEFLTARTAVEDFHNQKHIVIGLTNYQKFILDPKLSIKRHQVINFYQKYYPSAQLSICKSEESEAMKIFVNSFYAIKIQSFNEFHQLATNLELDYPLIRTMMLKNGWIHPNHTTVPGHDGQLSYGGACFPKDTNALLAFMKEHQSPHQVLEATIKERNTMRQDQ